MRLCDLRKKEVINICDCQRLGPVCDVEMDICCQRITHIIVSGPCKLWGVLGRENEYVIDVCHIRQVGDDVILVEVNLEHVVHKCKY